VTVYRWVLRCTALLADAATPGRHAVGRRRFFERAIGATNLTPVEVVTDQAPVYPAVLEEFLPAAWHRTEQYANNRVEADHGRLKVATDARAQPGPQRQRDHRRARLHQNLRRGHSELAVEEPTNRRLVVAFDELVLAI
jgi:IS6 family transposase